MKISKVIFLIAVTLSFATMGCSNAGMGTKGRSHRVGSNKANLENLNDNNTSAEGQADDQIAGVDSAEGAAVNETIVVNDNRESISEIDSDNSRVSSTGVPRHSGQTIQPVIIVEEKSTQSQTSQLTEVQVSTNKKVQQVSRPVLTQPTEHLPKPIPPRMPEQAVSPVATPSTGTLPKPTAPVQAAPVQAAPVEATSTTATVAPAKARPIVILSVKTGTNPAAQVKANSGKRLPVYLSYSSQTARYESTLDQRLIAELLLRTNIMDAQKARTVSDEDYEVSTRVPTYGILLPNNLFNTIVPANSLREDDRFYPCDLNAVGPCIVLEKNTTATGVTERVFVLGSVTPVDSTKSVELARRNIGDENIRSKVHSFLNNKKDGLYVYSSAQSREETVEAYKSLISAEEAAEILRQDESIQAQANLDAKIKSILDESEKARISREIDEAVAMSTVKADVKNQKTSGLNKCLISSAESDKRPGHGMKTVRRIVILDFVNFANVISGKGELPYRIGKGYLDCKLFNGDVQHVAILIKEFISPITVGIALTKNRQTLKAAGVGFANGARDILEIKDYRYIVEINATALGSLSLSPFNFSANHPNAAVLAGVLGYSDKIDWPGVRVTIGGNYEITVDPDDT